MRKIAIIDNLSGHADFCSRGEATFSIQKLHGVVGGNTGNVAYVSGTRKIIANPQRIIGWGSSPEIVRREADHIVICCANQIGAHVDLDGWARCLLAFGLPVTLIGLGAQTLTFEEEVTIPEGTLRFLQVVGELNESRHGNIGVRGAFTKGVLDRIGVRSVVTGCPSLFLNPTPGLGRKIAARQLEAQSARLAVAAGNPHHTASRGIEPLLMRVAERNHGAYIIQHPDLMMALGTGMHSPETDEKIGKLLHVFERFQSVDALKAWCDRHAYAFWDSGHWIQFLRHFDGVVGPRFHGVALGVQAGIPGVVLEMDNRTRELSTTSAIPRMPVDEVADLDLPAIAEAVRWDEERGQAFDANRQVMAGVIAAFAQDNGLAVDADVAALQDRA